MRVEVVYAGRERQTVIAVDVPASSTVGEVLNRVRAQLRVSAGEIDLDGSQVGVFGEVCDRDRTLVDGDRVEIYRPLSEMPKARV